MKHITNHLTVRVIPHIFIRSLNKCRKLLCHKIHRILRILV
ncbi:hypothetical protein BMB171_C4619 [Bacillus thuringiensis BMB171]|nr:hypothetical protein BMB171_C4619 [Bacillus thuringiensis BMB171]